MLENKAAKPMKRVLRHVDSRKYFTGGGWSEHMHEATTFPDVLEAAQSCVQHRLRNVELALRMDGGTSDIFCTKLA